MKMDLDINIQSTTDRREALKGAKLCFVVVRVGGLEAFSMMLTFRSNTASTNV